MDLTSADVANLAQAIGVPIAIAALFYSGWQLRRTRIIEQGRFMLELEQMSVRFDRVQTLLRKGGAWHAGRGGPSTLDEWVEVEDYMGFFEHCELLLKTGTIEPIGFKALYGYRIENIACHPILVAEKLEKEREYWLTFLALCRRFDIPLAPAQPASQLDAVDVSAK